MGKSGHPARRAAPVADRRTLGLVEITAEPGRVWLELYPPGGEPVRLPMSPGEARDLSGGLEQGAQQAERNGRDHD